MNFHLSFSFAVSALVCVTGFTHFRFSWFIWSIKSVRKMSISKSQLVSGISGWGIFFCVGNKSMSSLSWRNRERTFAQVSHRTVGKGANSDSVSVRKSHWRWLSAWEGKKFTTQDKSTYFPYIACWWIMQWRNRGFENQLTSQTYMI